MKGHLILLAAALIALPACEKAPNLPDCLKEESGFKPDSCQGSGTCVYEFHPNSRLNVHDGQMGIEYQVDSGDFLVFHYQYTRTVLPPITDAGYSESVWFQVKPDGNTFVLESKDLNEAGAIFGRFCFCPFIGYIRVTEGCIYGRKTCDDSWEVWFNLTAAAESENYVRMKHETFDKATGQ